MENIKTPEAKKQMAMKLIGVAVVVLVVVGIIILAQSKKNTSDQANQETPTQTENPTGNQEPANPNAPTDGTLTPSSTQATVNPILVDAKREAPGANLISKNGQVITEVGEIVKNDVSPMAPTAPQQTGPITKEQVSGNAIKIDVSAAGYAPNSFTVKKGVAVTLALSSTDQWVHMLKFEAPELQAVGTSVSAGTTRAITFQAPTTAGEYKFFCDIPGHVSRGETGVMIVQ